MQHNFPKQMVKRRLELFRKFICFGGMTRPLSLINDRPAHKNLCVYQQSVGTSLVWTPTQKNDFLGPVKSSKQIKVWWSKTKQNMLEHKLNGDILLTLIPPPGTDVCFKEDLNFSGRLNRNVVIVLLST